MNFLSPQWTLSFGIFLSFFVTQNEKVQVFAKRWGSHLLQLSVILLGASLNFHSVLEQGAQGLGVTFISISSIFLLGYFGRKLLKIEEHLGTLITMGTAICGGSAIGALAPVLKASSVTITISMAIVFLLNALAVFIFPPIGHYLNLTQEQFGLWSALAIHDTSSVVASAGIYGPVALAVATTTKLTRALWIIPISLIYGLKSNGQKKITLPWFILGFLILSLAFTFIDALTPLKEGLHSLSKLGFSLTLFFIGLSFNFRKMKELGISPLLFGITLWIIVVVASLFYVRTT